MSISLISFTSSLVHCVRECVRSWLCGSTDLMFSTCQVTRPPPPDVSLHASNLCPLCVYYGNYCIFLKVFFFFLSLNKIKRNLQCCVILCNIICKYLLLHQQIENKIKRRQKFKKCCCSFWACACLRWD